ncbi:hypothetical protein ACFV2H_43710 [Streptomyces sp. NPDC059629]
MRRPSWTCTRPPGVRRQPELPDIGEDAGEVQRMLIAREWGPAG